MDSPSLTPPETCDTTAAQESSKGRRVSDPAGLQPRPAYVGFIIAGLFLAYELIAEVISPALSNQPITPLSLLIGLAGTVYWQMCLYRIHEVLRIETQGTHPVSPGWAVGGHFIPFYNFYWMFKWPGEWVRALKANGQDHVLPGAWLGVFALAGWLAMRAADGALGLAALFWLMNYLNWKTAAAFRPQSVRMVPHNHPRWSIASIALAGAAAFTTAAWFVFALVIETAGAGAIDRNPSLASLVGNLLILAMLMTVSGLWFGILGIVRRSRLIGLAIMGVTISSLLAVLYLYLFASEYLPKSPYSF